MSQRFLGAVVVFAALITFMLLTPFLVMGQVPASVTKAASTTKPVPPTKTYTPPKTAWGDPDLQGIWPGTDLIGVPVQRDPKFGTRNVLTEDEFAQRQKQADQQTASDREEFVKPG